MLCDWMLWLVTCPPDDERGWGCFVVNTATQLGTTDEQISLRTEAAFDVTRQALRSLLLKGCGAGELTADLDIDGAVSCCSPSCSDYVCGNAPATTEHRDGRREPVPGLPFGASMSW
ncbi:TetR family transcriptional regulator C-terminal domain-containing protein [Streptomyces roseochromogenus]|uniref:Tetracyclin repressor-like C-terminal domain-containing protein n=1 Tax=Streptomyces roseochromogenus subsp. oscitans DS 12.976 TaxID=1352936 RepID=V6KNK4_STRRC|nr:hypothetical protein [Streptomyces roseochromogenus]EST30589.1 hypothetical protein M878_17895 [Streptomyces roseochromogenus subsp. oscitans DS 12.976]